MVMEEISPSTPLHDILNEQGERMARQNGMSKKEFLHSEELKNGGKRETCRREWG